MNKNHHSRTEARPKFSENKTASDYVRNRKPRGLLSRGAEQVGVLLRQGLTRKQIAERLGFSLGTVTRYANEVRVVERGE